MSSGAREVVRGWLAPLALLAAATFVPAGARAAECSGDDEITLKDGGMLRGTVVAVEPKKRAVILVCGEKRTLSWAEIDRIERGKHAAPAEPATKPEPAPKPEPRAEPAEPPEPFGVGGLGLRGTALAPGGPGQAPPPPGPGVVRLHIFTDDPSVQLYRVGVATFQQMGNTIQVGVGSEGICQAPCDTIIDGRSGADYYFAGKDIPASDSFQLLDREGDVAVAVDPGSGGLRVGGAWAVLLGGSFAVLGAIFLPIGLAVDSYSSGETFTIFGEVSLAAGGGALVGGILMLSAGATEVELVTPAAGEKASAPAAAWRF
ncbi:MAG: hypothetical protein HY744_13075 [Deltaproteobacteria bacterium]|nr:hypothetical protein [Deltaproteobacteria bacterium]